jgi:hypothetical protein
MKKSFVIGLLLSAFVLLTTGGKAFAQKQDFIVRATIPAANGATFVVSKITQTANGLTFTPQATTTLDFLTLPFVTKDAQGNSLNIFLAPFFWGIDVASNGAGNPDVQIQYTDAQNPNATAANGRAGLTKKGTLTAFRVQQSVVNGNTVDTPTVIRQGILGAFTGAGQTIQDQIDLKTGFLRIFLGISTGDPAGVAGSEPFTALDKPGVYSGTLTLTATFDAD